MVFTDFLKAYLLLFAVDVLVSACLKAPQNLRPRFSTGKRLRMGRCPYARKSMCIGVLFLSQWRVEINRQVLRFDIAVDAGSDKRCVKKRSVYVKTFTCGHEL